MVALNIENEIPYVCSLSKLVRAGITLTGLSEGVKRMAYNIVKDFDNNPELKASLKQRLEKGHFLRQVDIRIKADDPVLFKCFVMWNFDLDCWHVMVEGVNEMCFEDGQVNF